MYILHSINNDSPHYLHVFEAANEANCSSLDEDIALGEKFQCLKSVAIRANQSLSSLDESLFIPHKRSK
jgi:hypothetical protein